MSVNGKSYDFWKAGVDYPRPPFRPIIAPPRPPLEWIWTALLPPPSHQIKVPTTYSLWGGGNRPVEHTNFAS